MKHPALLSSWRLSNRFESLDSWNSRTQLKHIFNLTPLFFSLKAHRSFAFLCRNLEPSRKTCENRINLALSSGWEDHDSRS
jgi:hypothetical protein